MTTDERTKVVALLTNARTLVARGWTQRAYARNAAGKDIPPSSARAVRYCIRGAVCRAAVRHPLGMASHAYGALRDATAHTDLILWNDERGRTQSEVVRAFDRAIAKVSGKWA